MRSILLLEIRNENVYFCKNVRHRNESYFPIFNLNYFKINNLHLYDNTNIKVKVYNDKIFNSNINITTNINIELMDTINKYSIKEIC